MRIGGLPVLVGLAFLPAGATSFSCGCPLSDCYSGADLEVMSVVSADQLSQVTLRICRNDVCAEGPVAGPFTGPLAMDSEIFVTSTVSTGDHPMLSVKLFSQIGSERLANGDIYRVETWSAGAKLGEESWTATYRKSEPPCGGHMCLFADLTT